jgi:hypothetical protein
MQHKLCDRGECNRSANLCLERYTTYSTIVTNIHSVILKPKGIDMINTPGIIKEVCQICGRKVFGPVSRIAVRSYPLITASDVSVYWV